MPLNTSLNLSPAVLRLAVSLVAVFIVAACTDDRGIPLSQVQVVDIPVANAGPQANQNISNPTLEIPVTYPVADGDELTLVWSEEFDGPEIDPQRWFFATGDGTEKGLPGGWGNNELQYYLPDNAMIVNGVLEITARRETVGDLDFTSARINTEDRFAFKYGRIEASIKMPSGQGLWPAFWMLSQDSDYTCGGDPCVWAAIGEIDIVEAINLDGTNGNEIFATIHYGGEFPANQSTSVTYTPSVDVTEDFHTYALEWDEFEIRWYFDGQLYAVQNSWNSAADNGGPGAPFNQNFHILLNLAVGGNFPGSPNGATPFPATMAVDWVRVYSGEEPAGPPPAAGTAGVYTETATESPIAVSSITNSADFGGNNTVADPNSTAIPAFEGGVALAIDYQDTGSTFGGVVLNFGGVDLTAYDTLNFTIDTSAVSGFADLSIQLEPPGAGAAGTNVPLSSYTAVSTSGNWATYAIPLADFTATDFSAVANLGFWNARDGSDALVFGTIYVDDVFFSTGGGSGGNDHGPGTAGVVTETTTESPITVTSITNSADFSGNNTVADPNSMAIPAFEGSVVLSIDYQDSGSTFGGVVLNFGGLDLTAYDTLNVTVDTSAISGYADLSVQLEPPGAGAAGTNVALSSYTPVATSGNWSTYAIPLADFTATDFSAVDNLGFWNVRDAGGALVFGTLYVDDVYFSTEGGAGGGGSGSGGALVPDGGFEAAGTSGLQPPWLTDPLGGTVSVSDANNNGGTYAARLQADATSGSPSFPILKVERLGAGSFTGGEPVTISFDAIDVDTTGAGKTFVAEFFTERSDPPGGATNEVILGGYGLSGAWQNFTFNTTLGADAAGGVSLLFKADCGANTACTMDVFIDNVSITVN